MRRADGVVARTPPEVPGFVPGAVLLHPVVLVAVALLALNDHVLKAAWPGPLTGKLSDLAGLAFFPLVPVAVLEWVRGRPAGRGVVLGAVAATGVGVVAVKTQPAAEALYEQGLGLLQWPARALVPLVAGADVPPVVAVALARDVTDLAALPALAVPLFFALAGAGRTLGAARPTSARTPRGSLRWRPAPSARA